MAGDDDDELVTFNSHDELEELICNLLAAVDVKRHNEQQVSQLTEQIVKLGKCTWFSFNCKMKYN